MLRTVSGTRGILAAVRCDPGERPALERRAAVLAAAYQEPCETRLFADLRWLSDGLAVWTLDLAAAAPGHGGSVLWGAMAGARSPESVSRAARDGADVAGAWVALDGTGDEICLASGPAAIHTIVRADGPAAVAFATRGMAAAVLAGVPLKLARDRIADWVFFDFVIGRDELLDGTVVLEEATAVTLTPAGVQARSWSPRHGRWAAGEPTTPTDLRAAVTSVAGEAMQTPGAQLGLTAGRDSKLIASTLTDGAGTFTIGWPGNPDTDGAADLAAILGHRHEIARVSPARVAGMDTLESWAIWQEGMENPRTVAVGPLAWERQAVTWVSGHGGEIGRSFYWAGGPPGDAQAALTGLMRPAEGIAGNAAETLKARLEAELAQLAEIRADPAGTLDLFYLSGRLHKWLGRILPYDQFDGIIPVYCTPEIARILLDLPQHQRHSGTAFDDALALDQRLHAPRSSTPAASPRRRLPHRLQTRIDQRRGVHDWRLLSPLIGRIDAPLVADVLGERWWHDTLASARTKTWSQTWIWNSLAVEALHRRISRLRDELAT